MLQVFCFLPGTAYESKISRTVTNLSFIICPMKCMSITVYSCTGCIKMFYHSILLGESLKCFDLSMKTATYITSCPQTSSSFFLKKKSIILVTNSKHSVPGSSFSVNGSQVPVSAAAAVSSQQ